MLIFDRISVSLQQALASALRRLAQLAHTSSWDQWASQRLTPTQRKILELLASRRESLTLSAVAQELGVTPATASDSLTALESKGLVKKRRSHVDGRALAIMLTTEGRRSVTALAALPDPLQAAFIERDAFQCGYCTPGQIMAGVACIAEGHAGSAEEIREWMSGNLCRCGAYDHIVAAIQDAAKVVGSVRGG